MDHDDDEWRSKNLKRTPAEAFRSRVMGHIRFWPALTPVFCYVCLRRFRLRPLLAWHRRHCNGPLARLYWRTGSSPTTDVKVEVTL